VYFLISTHLFLFFFSFSSSSISNGAFRCHILLRLILSSRCEHWRLVSAGPFQFHPCVRRNHDAICPSMIKTAVLVLYLLSSVRIDQGLKSLHPHPSSTTSASSPCLVPASSQNLAMRMSLDDKPRGLCVVQRTWVLLKTFVHSG
jgi:hypothetical protein